MKILAFAALLPSLAVAAPLLPTFDSNSAGASGPSLMDAIDSGQRPAVAPPVAPSLTPSQLARWTKDVPAVQQKLVSRMPVIAPREVDPKMPFGTPDPSTDFKLAIVEPKVEPAR